MTSAAFIYPVDIERYEYPAHCPFRTVRAAKTRKELMSRGMLDGPKRRQVSSAPAGRDDLEKFHTPQYLDALEQAPKGHLDIDALHMGLGTADCPVFEGMYEYALLAAGASIAGAELILAGEADVAFNPSGGHHHAHPQLASGFCYINDVVLATMKLAEAGKKVAVVDIDAHHSDGVMAAFYDRRDVLVISQHQDGRTLFPGTGFANDIGVGEGVGFSVNLPMPPGVFDDAYLRAFREITLAILEAFAPDVIVTELGMDSLAGDPLTNMSLTNNAYATAISHMLKLGRPILATGGGGYHIENTVRGWTLAWSVLCGAEGDDTTDASLRDRTLAPSQDQRLIVDAAVDQTIQAVKENVFALHGL